MSGDVQPRKRKDKKKKKDDLGIEEPRGTAAALGEGDIFMHSQHEHDTGGHWCAKVIFFSLLAVLITLIGLIILENRGLSELEANSVESRYSGVLEGWLEEGHDDDHHDEHTLDLHHHDNEDDDDHSAGLDHDDDNDNDDHDDDDEHSQEDEDEENNEQSQEDDENEEQDQENDDEDEIDNHQDSEEQNDADDDSEENDVDTAEGDEDEVEEQSYRRFYRSVENQATDDDVDDHDDDDNDDDNDLRKVDDNDGDHSEQNDDDDLQDNDDEDTNDSQENDEDDDAEPDAQEDDDDDDDYNENDQDEAQDDEDEDEHEEQDMEEAVEVEHIEKEVFDDDVSVEAREPDEDDKSEEVSDEVSPVDDADEDEVEFLEPGDLDDLPDAMPIPVAKRPLVEVEDTTSTEVPQDTLADEEEYEKQQEALRKEKEEASQGIWLKLVVGGALLVATQAVLRRATAPREPAEVDTTREETPLSDRRMTLIPEPPVTQTVAPKQEVVPVQREVIRQAPVIKSQPTPPPEEEDVEEEEVEEEEIVVSKQNVQPVFAKKDVDKELYSDEEDVEDEEEEEEEMEPIKPTRAPIKEPIRPIKDTPKPIEKKELPKPEKEPSPEEEYEDDDVEIIEEEDVAEEDEEEISDVDDAELLNRLEAKYGRLPAAERPGFKKDGGNSIDDEWPGEPSDAYWRDELDVADRDLRQGEWTSAAERANAPSLRGSGRAKYIVARALDAAAEAKRDNTLLTKAIAAYLEVLKMNERLSDKKLVEVAERTLDRIQFRGNYLGAEPVYRLLIRRFPDEPVHRNNLTVSFLMANRVDLAEEVIKETLARWPNDRVALAHHGFILKTLHNKNEEAVKAFTKALEDDTGAANEPRFYYHFGDSLLLLGRFKEAHEVHKRGTKLGHFLSPSQRSLYNVKRLKSKPWWDVEKTPYLRLVRALEKSWKEILKEGQAAQALYEKEKEGLKERGEWSQLDLFVRGREVPNRCARAPVTCSIVKTEAAASGCRRGQVKFSSMEAGTHVRPHVGPTNCRLRMHLGLSNTRDTYIRVDHETRQWQIGKVLMFDDSFEHEVWHNGTGTRLVLIIDVWHPDLTPAERRQLPAI